MILTSFASLAVIVSPSLAQVPAVDGLPAVSQVNGKISLEGGSTGSPGRCGQPSGDVGLDRRP